MGLLQLMGTVNSSSGNTNIARFVNPAVVNGWAEISSGATGSFSILQNSGYGISVSATGGVTINSPTNQVVFTQAANTTSISFGQQGTNPTTARFFANLTTSSSSGTAFTPTTGTAGLYTLTNAGNSSFQPSSGTAIWTTLHINTTINQTGSASGAIYGIDYDPILTSVTGTHYGLLIRPVDAKNGFGVSTPTASVDIVGSTTSMSSFRIRTGVAPSTPNDGDIWQDGTDIKIRIGGVTKTFVLV
jgi:hypothetical protein